MASNNSKKSVCDGILGIGVPLAARVAGVEVEPQIPQNGNQTVEWNDEEERRYREWIREITEKRAAEMPLPEWKEQMAEQAYRDKLKQDTENAADADTIEWSDETEREFRRRYIEMRQKEMSEEANFDEYKQEEEYRDKIRKKTLEQTSKKPVVWDDDAERKFQKSYRNKY